MRGVVRVAAGACVASVALLGLGSPAVGLNADDPAVMEFDTSSQSMRYNEPISIPLTFSNFFLIGTEGTLDVTGGGRTRSIPVTFSSIPDPAAPQGTVHSRAVPKDPSTVLPPGKYTVIGSTFETTYEQAQLPVATEDELTLTVTPWELEPLVQVVPDETDSSHLTVNAGIEYWLVTPTGTWKITIVDGSGATVDEVVVPQNSAQPTMLVYDWRGGSPGSEYHVTVAFTPDGASREGFTAGSAAADATTSGTATATPTPTPSSSPTRSPSPRPVESDGGFGPLTWVMIVGGVVLLLGAAGALVAFLVVRRRSATPPDPTET